MAEIKKYLDNAGLQTLVTEIKAADAKVLADAKTYAEGLGVNYDAAGAAATAKSEAISHADTEIAKLADGQVKTNKEAIATLNGIGEGSVAKAVADAKTELQGKIDAVDAIADKNAEDIAAINNTETGILKQAKDYTDSEVAKVQGSVDTLAGKVGVVPEGSTVMGIITNIQENAYDDTELRGLVDGLGETKADKEQVAKDIAAAVKVEEEARIAAVSGVQGAVDGLAQTHATDKSTLEGAIALKADITALNAVSDVANAAVKQSDYDVKVKALEDEDVRIVGLVEAEAERAAGVEAGLEERLVEVEAFFKLAEGEQLDTALDTLKEIQEYVTGEGAAADQMVLDIAANKKAIEDHVATNHDFAGADAALKAELEGKINGKVAQGDFDVVEGRVDTLEGEMDAVEGRATSLEGRMTTVEGAVATKAEAQDLTDAVAALEGADAGLAGRIEALEAKHGDGEGTVESLIATAKQEAIDAAAADATTKAGNAETAAKGHADSLNTAMNTRVEALEAIDHDHSNKAELDLIVSGDKAKWDDAAAKAHEHANKGVIDGITAEKVAAWDAAEGNAKTYADGLNTTMQGVVDGIGGRVGTLESTITTKADASALTSAVERIAANELAIQANASAIAGFSAIESSDITKLFA